MLLSITHRTQLDYAQPITESVMEVRARPRLSEQQVLRQFDISIQPYAKASHHEDWLGNTVHQFSVLGAHRQVIIEAQAVVETWAPRIALAELRQPLRALTFDHRSWDFLQDHGPATDDPSLPILASKLGLDRSRTLGEAVELVLTRTQDVINYQRGVTDSNSTVRDVLRLGAGVCQDFAHLALSLLRRAGLPSRYVSGYLYKPGTPELETHAWLEVFVPERGWLGVDPTHAALVDDHYVVLAVGRSYADVPPNRGVYRGDAAEKIAVSVQMTPLETVPSLTASAPSMRPASRHREVPNTAAAYLAPLSGLEQQRYRPNAVGLVVQQQRQQQQ